MSTKSFLKSLRASLVTAALAVPLPALAGVRFYIGPDGGNWSTPANWTNGVVPISSDDVWIQPSAGDRDVIMDVSYAPPGIASLSLSGLNFSTAIVTQSLGTLIVNGNEHIGGFNNSRGRYVQSGGTHTVGGQGLFLGLDVGCSGSYELSGGGVLNVNANSGMTTTVGGVGSGIFTQTGGTHNVYRLEVGARYAGGSGNYSISAGTINATVIAIGDPGNGYFQQTGGNVNAVFLQTGIGGNYNLTDGNLTVTGTFNNNSNYNQSHGFYTGSITNNGSFSLGGGVLTVNGTGFNNSAFLNLSGGTIQANAAITNNGQISFYGTPAINGASPFNNLGVINQGGGTLTISAPASNSGNINLAAGGGIALTGANYTNNGTINLGSGRISGSAQLINRPGATITGAGLISSSFDNQGGRLLLTDGTTLITNGFNNSGIIQLAENAASLSGGVITNTGQITGHGSTGNTISNTSGTIEASGGTLILGGVVTNGAGGTIGAPSGGKVFVSLGLGTSSGLINLTGGTFDNNAAPLNNTGQISGFGTIRTGASGLTNNNSMTLTGGFTTINGNVTNNANSLPLNRLIKIAYNPALFTGNVVNNGIFKTTSTTVTFAGSYTENGTFISDPADTYFLDVFLNPGGSWNGGVGDRFFVKGVLDWAGGSMSGSGAQTFNQGSATLHDAGVKTLDGWTFNNEKPLTLSGGNINMGNGAIINNTNTFDFQSDAGITNTLGGAATFANAATLRKSAGTGSSDIAALVSNNNGNIDVQAGTLTLSGGLNIAAATTLQKTGGGTLRVSGPQSHGANSNLNIQAGTVRLASDAGTPATGGAGAGKNLAVNLSGIPANTALVLEFSQDLRDLVVPFVNAGNQSVDLNTPASVGSFNALRVYAADLTAAKTTLWSAIKNANGPGSLTPTDGIYDSGKAAHANSGIGLARINDAHGDPHIQIRLTRTGDLNLDGTVSISDFIGLASNFNSSGPNITWQEGDLNYDGRVTISDFIDLAANFNSSYAGAPDVHPGVLSDYDTLASFASSIGVDPSIIGSAVPEPTVISTLAVSALLVGARRRRTTR